MSLYTVDLQVTRDAAIDVVALLQLDYNAPDGLELISSNQLYADLKSVYFRLEVFSHGIGADALRERIQSAGETVLQHRVREDVSVYEGPLIDTTATRNIDFRKNFMATAPAALRQARDRLYSRPEDLDRLRGARVGLLSDGSRYEHRHYASPHLERDAFLLARHAGLQPGPLWLDARNEEELIRTVQAVQGNFSSLRLSGLDPTYAMEVAERLEEIIEVPFIHAEAIERPLLMAAVLQNAARFHDLTLSGATGAVIGLGPEGEGLLDYLLQFGLTRVYGIDSDLRQVSRFEKRGGIASSIDHVYDYADFVVITPDCPVRLDDNRFHAGQMVLSFHAGSINPRHMKAEVAERCYQGGEPHPVFVLPGLFGAIQRTRPRKITDDMLRRFLQTLITRGDQSGFLPVPSQELFKAQFESLA
ncbi:MAG: hypothetical protein NXI24_15565 [bacterium]|nr:hypothetical protein [bacterium]